MSALIALISLVIPVAPAWASVPCRLQATNAPPLEWDGACGPADGKALKVTLKAASMIASGRWRRGTDPVTMWAGQATASGNTSPIELEIYSDGTGVLRTERGWYPVSRFTGTTAQLTFELDTTQTVPPSELDREIIRRADALLTSDAVWNRHDDRRCPEPATTWSIYCALVHATIVTTCGAHHRRPALEVVRELIESRTAGRNYAHRLMDYNNDSTTTLADVRSLFREAWSRAGGRGEQPLGDPPSC